MDSLQDLRHEIAQLRQRAKNITDSRALAQLELFIAELKRRADAIEKRVANGDGR